jgi:hypothetical protein
MLAGVTVSISGCGSENPAGPQKPHNLSDRTATVADNHGHDATITAAQQAPGGSGVSLNIQGAARHNHVLELTAAEVKAISHGMRVTKSCMMANSHMHAITFNA